MLNRTTVDTVAVRRVRRPDLAGEVVDRADRGQGRVVDHHPAVVNAGQQTHHPGAVEFERLAGNEGGGALRASYPSQARYWSS